MAIRTVRLDDEAESVLRQIREATGLPISRALKEGLRTLQQHVRDEANRMPYDVYRELDVGRGIRKVLRKKLRR
jgi:hypothetical protein